MPVVPPPIVAKSPEPEKLKAPVKPEEKAPAVPAPASALAAKLSGGEKTAPPAIAKALATDKQAAPEKLPVPVEPAVPPRVARARKRRLISTIFFYLVLVAVCVGIYYFGFLFSHETRLEGQVIPPDGMLVGDEAWIVNDFRDLLAQEAEDLADRRTPKLQDIQEKLNHVQRAQADIAAREERVRLLQGQMQAAKDEIATVIKQTRDAAQQLWDGPGAQIDQDYDARQQQLGQTIADRAKALKLNYQPDPNFNSPEVWANSYRLALYQVPAGVDSSKELLWLDDQMKQWRDFTKSVDDQKEKIREQVAAVKQSPGTKISDLQGQIDDLQHRIDSTLSEETPIKTELQQAEADLTQSQGEMSNLEPYYLGQLYSIPESKIVSGLRLPIKPNGRFSWRNIEKDMPFSEGDTSHSFWIFSRAVRGDGRQYWALARITVDKDSTLQVVIEPEAYTSTRAILRPDLSPDERQQ